MKRLLGFVLAVGAGFAAFGFVRSLQLSATEAPVNAAPHYAIADEAATLERLGAALRIQTVSHHDPTQDDPATFRAFREHLERSFPRMHAALGREIVNGESLLYRWQGKDPERPAILLMAHQDVVPIEPGTESRWIEAPFSGAVKEGFVWGRGALDVKSKLTAQCEAVERLLAEGFVPPRTIYLAFGHDEEVGGARGNAQIASMLGARHERLSWVLDEGGIIGEGLFPGVEKPLALVGIAEKGYLSLDLTAKAEGGHSSMPHRESTIGILAAAIERLERRPFPAHLRGATRAFLRALAPDMSFARRYAIANPELFEPVLTNQLSTEPRGNASVRTTTAVTMINAGVKDNVLPSSAVAVVNFRLLPGDTMAYVIDEVRRIIADPRVSVRKHPGANANEASRESHVDSPSFALLARTIRASYPGLRVVPNLVLGATDSRHYGLIADEIYRFGPIRYRPEDLARIHGTNERVAVADYLDSIGFYVRLIKAAK